MHEDGTFEMAPMQIFRLPKTGMTVLRLGRNAFFFDKDGHYDGSECKLPDETSIEDTEEIRKAFERAALNHGRVPAEPYFRPERGEAEVEQSGWPKKRTEH